MRWKQVAPVAVAVALVSVFGWRAAALSGAAAPRATVVATVDLQRVINGLEELAQRQKEFDAFREDQKTKVDAKQRKLDEAEAALKVLPENSPEHFAKFEEYRRLTFELEFEGKLAAASIDERRGMIYAAIFKKVTESAARLAKQNGYDLIISDDMGAETPRRGTEQQIRGLIVSRKVLYSAPTIDATDALLSMMNNEHKLGRAGQ